MTRSTRQLCVHSGSPEQTVQLAKRSARHLPTGFTLHVTGELGVGKTTFVRGLLRGCGVQDNITSPTFSLLEHYMVDGRKFVHADFYRCQKPDEWLDSGLDEVMDGAVLSVVEWPERAGFLPLPDVAVAIAECDDDDSRDLLFASKTGKGRQWLRQVRP